MNKPKDHQKEAISDILEGFATAERGQCIMPCGTGKTLVGLWTAERLGAELILLTAPTLALVKQLSETYAANASAPFAALAVCSDESVLKGELDDGVRVADIGERVTTDKKEVREFLRGSGRRVVFSTYHSSEVIQKAQAVKDSPRFDLLIADEAHRCAGGSGGPFQIVLGERKIKADRRLFMTATPRWASKFHKQTELVGMDNPALFGEELHRLHYTDAVDRGLVVPFKVICVGCNSLEYAQMVKDEKMVRFPGIDKLPADDLMQRGMVLKAMKKNKLKKVFSYHSRTTSAREFADGIAELHDALPASERPAGGLWAMSLDGTTPNTERSAILADFEAVESPAILSSCQVLSEGVDAPAADAVVFCDPTRSINDNTQRVGRISRPFPGKEVATVILPVVVPEGDYDEALASSAYDGIWKTLQALAAVDETFAAELNGVARERGRTGEGTIQSDRLIFDFPKSVSDEFLDGFESRVLEVTTTSFETFIGSLTAFSAREGHCRPHRHHIENGYPLGARIHSVRAQFSVGQLSQTRIALCNEFPGFEWNIFQADLDEFLDYLKVYVDREGDALVPVSHIEAGYPLGAKAASYRKIRKESPAGRWARVRNAKLDAVPGWSPNYSEARFRRRIAAIEAFAEEHGHLKIPKDYEQDEETGEQLGWQMTNLRRRFRDGTLPDWVVRRLNLVECWSWDFAQTKLDVVLHHLDRYIAREGNSLVPQSHKEDGFPLGVRLQKYRRNHLAGKLAEEIAREFERRSGWAWAPKEARRLEVLGRLDDYVRRNGKIPPYGYVEDDGFRLGKWANRPANREACTDALSSSKPKQLAA